LNIGEDPGVLIYMLAYGS